jgi:hypothetical protein
VGCTTGNGQVCGHHGIDDFAVFQKLSLKLATGTGGQGWPKER